MPQSQPEKPSPAQGSQGQSQPTGSEPPSNPQLNLEKPEPVKPQLAPAKIFKEHQDIDAKTGE